MSENHFEYESDAAQRFAFDHLLRFVLFSDGSLSV